MVRLRRAEATQDVRRQFLKDLSSRFGKEWEKAPLVPELVGPTRVETRRKSYRFDNGVCVEVVRRDGLEGDDDPLLGMRIAGWIAFDESGKHPMMSATWRPNFSAVLFRAAGRETQAAMTSPSFAFLHAGNTRQEADVRDLPTSRFHEKEIAPARAPSVARLEAQSMTRMFF